VIYDFVANAGRAQWKSGAGIIPFPGTSGDSRGFSYQIETPHLEDDSLDTSPGLLVVPQNKFNGYIQTTYPEFHVQKGDRLHKKIGRAFLIGMVATGISAFVLAVIRPNQFLFAVGVFSVYMVVSGYRYIRWNPAEGRHFGWFDRALTAAMVLAGLYFLWLGGLALSRANAFGTVFLVFGLLGGMYVVQDLRYHGGRAKRANFALLAHIQRMTGGFIASLTAFLVVNARHLPSEIPGAAYWLLPTVVFTPLIVHWSRKAAKAQ